jgi:hypothetical protein
MSDTDWVVFRNYSAQYEADLAIGVLTEAGIPVMTRGPITGAFGPAFAGPTVEGVTVLVPAEYVEEARDLLAEE